MSDLLIAGLIALYSAQAAFCNLYSKYYPGEKRFSSPVYSTIYGFLVAAATLALTRLDFHPSSVTLWMGALTGIVLTVYNALLIAASETGPFSILMTFNMSGALLGPVLWSAVHDGDMLSVWEYLAIAVLLVSCVFLNWEKKPEGEDTRPPFRFYLISILLAVDNSAYGVLLHEQKKATNSQEDAEMIVVTFAVSAVLALVVLLILGGRKTKTALKLDKRSTGALLGASLAAAGAVNLLMFSLSLIHMAILFSLDIGGELVVAVLFSAIVLREKFPPQRIVGLVLAISAIFTLSIL